MGEREGVQGVPAGSNDLSAHSESGFSVRLHQDTKRRRQCGCHRRQGSASTDYFPALLASLPCALTRFFLHFQEETEDAAKAAHLGMFGKLTHEEFEWHPADLLCRRFNVPNPYPK